MTARIMEKCAGDGTYIRYVKRTIHGALNVEESIHGVQRVGPTHGALNVEDLSMGRET
jgi:hypothetical protein